MSRDCPTPALSAEDPYYRFSRYLKLRFPWKTYKVTLHAGFTCPNIDGTLSRGGCTYCDNRSFAPQLELGGSDITQQMAHGKARLRSRYGAEKFIAYFQSFTNTYGPLASLRQAYDQVMTDPEVVALAIGTRPDCVPDAALDLLASYASDREVWVEYGMQSAHDRTAVLTNRCQTVEQFVDAMERTAQRPRLKICVHVILGLPGEDHEMMMQSAELLGKLPYDSIKIHHLYITQGTRMAEQYAAEEVRVLSLDEYVPLVVDFIERLAPSVSIQRLMGELKHPSVSAPRWGQSKGQIEQSILREFKQRGSFQGIRHRAPACSGR